MIKLESLKDTTWVYYCYNKKEYYLRARTLKKRVARVRKHNVKVYMTKPVCMPFDWKDITDAIDGMCLNGPRTAPNRKASTFFKPEAIEEISKIIRKKSKETKRWRVYCPDQEVDISTYSK